MSMQSNIRCGAAGTAALLLAGISTPVLAQAVAGTEEATQTDDEVIVVTGSRIEGLPSDGPVQTISIGRDDIVESGAGTIIEVLQDLPVATGGGATFSTATAGPLSSDTPVGASAVSLRGLGASSTLTLINGRRAQISAFARGQESFIDASSIPLAAVERVEVLPSGASAIYGADAVAGVVNYVLRDDFEGIELTASYGNSTAGTDEGRYNITGVVGTRLGDRNSVMLVVDYFKRNPFFLRDRAISRDSFRPSQQGFYPSYNDLFFQFFDQTEEPADGGCAADDFGFGNFGEFCEVNTNAFISAQDRLETIGGLFTHQFEISDRLTWYNDVLYSRVESRGISSPANFSRAPIDPENPFWPAALQADIVEEGGVTDFSDYFGFPIFAWGKIPEPRAVEIESDSYRITSGLRGDLAGDWRFDAAFLFGGNDRIQRGLSGLVVAQNFYDLNLGNICTDGTRVERWDVDPGRPTADFVGDTCEDIGLTTLWYNPFGGQTTQEAGVAELLGTEAERSGKSRLYAFDASVNGTLLEMPAGPLKAAFGGEFRRETLRDTPSGIAVATIDNPEPILGFSSTSAEADRNSWSLYGEFYVPLAAGLDLQLAGRFDDFEGFGSDFNPKIAARWEPVDWLALRANYSTSFRAPSLAQSGAGVLLSSYRVDCEATPGACDDDPTADGEALLSEDVGNPNLGAENARSFGGGIVVMPNSDIELRVDYWNIRHEDLVGIDEDDFIRRALAGEFAVVGDGELATGTPGLEVTNGFVTDAHFQITNLGFQKTDGIDFAYTHRFGGGDAGDFTFLLDATHILNFERKASEASPLEQLAGDYLYPDFIASGKLRWRKDEWRAALSGHYKSGYRDDPSDRTLEALGLPLDSEYEVDDYLTFDLSVSYDFAEDSFIQLSLRNILDADPPRVLGSSSNVDLFNHDLIGRYATIRVTKRF
ncbi:TonB-dependent receptor plug domain-containing protein [Qipengyuania vesicularis]|uniref:TonB-dependent receptor plug domain-containing protein n=1 Tax=Qipengyuania vesicularis TaxID=2867232 RepID=UPI001C884541|nr:TonB-dependent receptor [Qipengyuania vesicularis]MBX7526489.1 TonB-dependent receptor [Qipengyuania vesicularis]